MTRPVKVTEEQKARAKELRAAGVSWRAISKELGISDHTLHSHVDPAYRERRRQYDAFKRGDYRENIGSFASGHRVLAALAIRIPAHVIADREKRYEANHADATGVLMGDPLPGYSAKDKRNA